jgi:type II secretory pathway pseudopilin PulG
MQLAFLGESIPTTPAALRTVKRTARCTGEAGFSIIEAVMVVVIVLLIVGSMMPSVNRQVTHARINRAANVGAADFSLAQDVAGRMRRPVRITVDTTAKTVSLTTVTDSLIQRRYYGAEGDFKLSVFGAAPLQVQVLPNGMASTTMIVTFGDGTYRRQARLSRAGQVRLLRM